MPNEDMFNNFEKARLTLQDHGLLINEMSNKGLKEIDVNDYLNLLNSFITYIAEVENNIVEYFESSV